MTATAVLPQTVQTNSVTILPADASALKTILTAGGVLETVNALSVCSDDSSDRLLAFYLTISAVDYLIGTVNIPTLSGTTATAPAVNILANAQMQQCIYDAFANRVLPLNTAIILKVKSTTTVTAAKTITITATSARY